MQVLDCEPPPNLKPSALTFASIQLKDWISKAPKTPNNETPYNKNNKPKYAPENTSQPQTANPTQIRDPNGEVSPETRQGR